jgi:transglutaminase-like putative cysteine protease
LPQYYPADEQLPLLPFRVPSYPHDASVVLDWLSGLHKPGNPVETFDSLVALNTRIYSSLKYVARYDPGVQLPCRTLEMGSGSYRDYAVLMMEAARHWGLAARFVSGYILIGDGQHGDTHAWTEIYLPGMGWCGFDPTNNKLASTEHVPVAVARDQQNASPLSGTWSGPGGAFESLEVVVRVCDITG